MACQAAILHALLCIQGSRSQHPLSGDWRRGDWCFVTDIESNLSLELLEEVLDHLQFDCKFTQILGSSHVKSHKISEAELIFSDEPRRGDLTERIVSEAGFVSDPLQKFSKMLS